MRSPLGHGDDPHNGERRRTTTAAVADHGRSEAAREGWDATLGAGLRARATELAELAVTRGDAVGRALQAALERAEEGGAWAEVAELAQALDAHRKARAGVVELGAERMKRGTRS